MRRRSNATNEVFFHTLVFFLLTMIVLLVVFLVLDNVGQIASVLELDQETYPEKLIAQFTNMNEWEEIEFANSIGQAVLSGPEAPRISIYSPDDDCTMITTQLDITKQPYTEVKNLSEVGYSERLLIIQASEISREDTEILRTLVNKGVSLLFIGVPDMDSLYNVRLRNLMGIQGVIRETSWRGIRTSQDLLTGSMVEMPKYRITGTEVILAENNKIYANALPKDYQEIPNMDLPPIIWRHIENGTSGKVYVFNGDYAKSEMGYGILPVVISEINEDYIYPIINANVCIVKGFPSAQNEERDYWQRLYARDKMQIQQDMFMSQLKKYSNIYKTKVSCFSPDYAVFQSTKDVNLKFYVNQIAAERGIIAAENAEGELSLFNTEEKVKFEKWTPEMEFWNEETRTVTLPICYDSTITNPQADEYAIAGFASTLGFFSVKIDYDAYLDYDGENDFWAIYCEKQEVMMGIEERDYGWLENVTADEAAGRILKLLEMKVNIAYNDDNIKINVENFEDEAWFLLRSDKEDIKIDNGKIVKTGEGCYFVTLTEKDATITWKE